jgi:rubredoxin
MGKLTEMYQCQVHYCGYVYDPDDGDPKAGIKAGTTFRDVPDTWKCPFCGAGKQQFRPLAGPGSVFHENISNNPAFEGQTQEEILARLERGEVTLKMPVAKRAEGKMSGTRAADKGLMHPQVPL